MNIRKLAIKGLALAFGERRPLSLMYHSISDTGPTFCVRKKAFRDHMDYVGARCNPISWDDLPRLDALPRTSTLVTFDDGFLDNYEEVVPYCSPRGIPVTIFVAWDYLGKKFFRGDLPMMTKEQVREIAFMPGVTIGSHTLSHPKLAKLDTKEQRREIFRSKQVLEDWLGREVSTFCYPFGSYSRETVRLVEESGYRWAATTKIGPLIAARPLEIERVPVNRFSETIFPQVLTDGYLKYAALVDKTRNRDY